MFPLEAYYPCGEYGTPEKIENLCYILSLKCVPACSKPIIYLVTLILLKLGKLFRKKQN